MKASDDVVFLLDCDNTLLDNDRVIDDLRAHLANAFGPESCDRYWAIFEALRAELGYADYLGALQRYRLGAMNEPRLLQMSSFLVDYPFAERLYPGALGVIEHLRRWGQRSSCPMATWFFSRARSNAQGCGKPSKAGC